LLFSSLSVLPPVFYPITEIPPAWQWVAFLSPTTFSAQLGDRLVGLPVADPPNAPFLGDPLVQVLGLVLVTLLFGLVAARLTRWRER